MQWREMGGTRACPVGLNTMEELSGLGHEMAVNAAAAPRDAPDSIAPACDWRDAATVPPDMNGPVGWPFVPLPPDAPDLPLLSLVERAAAHAPEALALDDGAERISYATLLDRVRRLAAAVARAAPPGGAVAVATPVGALQAICLLAVVGSGRVAAAIDLHAPPQRRAALLEASGAAAVLVDAAAGEVLPESGTRLVDARALSHEGGAPGPLPATDPDAPAVILLTSGSTGEPKGIVNSQAALTQRALVHVAASHIGRRDRLAPLSAPSSIAGLREVLAGLVTGAAVHLVDPRGHEARHTLARLAAVRPTVVYAVPTLIRALCRLPEARRAFSALRVLRLGGEAIHWADIARLRPHLPASACVMAAYSSTETVGAHWFVPPGAKPDAPTVPAGHVAPGSRFCILGEDGRAGAEGELVMRGRYVALGHWQQGRCVPGPMARDPDDPRARIFRTGDRARLLPDGRLALLGRLDGMAKIAGQRVEPREIEATMRAWPDVDDAAVIVVEAEPGRPKLVGFLVPHDQEDAGLAEAARRRLAAALPAAMQPARIHLLDEVPMSPGGKPDRAALARFDAEAQRAPASHGEADPEVAWAVGKAWTKSFGRRSLAADERFQDAGGDSLALVRLAYDIEQRLGTFTFLPLDLFSPDMRPSELIGSITGLVRSPAAPGGVERPQLFLLPGLGGDEPLLALFRADLADRMQVVTPPYPGWRELARGGSLEGLAEALAARIAAEARPGPIRLAGYSFGGIVAAAVAARLLAGGREVGFLGLLDSPATAGTGELHGPALRRAIAGQGVMRQALLERRVEDVLGMVLAESLARPALAPALARLAGLGAPPLPRRTRFAARAWLQALLRAEASRAWLAQPRPPLPASVRVALFRSDAHGPEEPRDLGWAARCGRLEVADVPGSHHGMFDAGNRALLVARFAEIALA